MTKTYIALDFETTGLNPETAKIVEVGAVKFDENSGVLDTFTSYANPNVEIPKDVQDICGITNEMIKDAPPPKKVWDDFLIWANNSTTYIAHNAKFEACFIKALYATEQDMPTINFLCTYEMSKERFPDRNSYKLEDLVPGGDKIRHRALPDAEACLELYRKLAATYESGKIPHETCIAPLNSFNMFDPATSKQLSYIQSLGGDASQARNKAHASAYIAALKRIASNKKLKEEAAGKYTSIT